ncbi:hypothetical protein QEH44_gp33 [Arthrobacter phage Shambre1]|uniref:Uncharacterized protein n=1 Tax=Arthrobacter phage Shambre1 TaxID=2927284 RepID=A0A977PRZ9_9CAUD|nr:hypothetical protein QEH44_gp33 [Arthrobacter phage Shambre1]UXE04769.1 hypothetical protein SEA_SHAMBRE1_33 [Arthrobacter phage Shambre1]
MSSFETAAKITHAQADLIASALRDAGMDTRVMAGSNRPIFTDCTGAQVMATVIALVARGELPLPFLIGQDWQTVSFEENDADGRWSSVELTWAD